MYGLLVESVCFALKTEFGEELFQQIVNSSNIVFSSFVIHETYGEAIIPKLVQKTAEVTKRSEQDIMQMCGRSFVMFLGRYSYDAIMKSLGNSLRDFLSCLDSLHECLRSHYPKLQSPSFTCEQVRDIFSMCLSVTGDIMVKTWKRKRDGRTEGRTGGRAGGRASGRTDGWMNGWTDERTDVRTDE